MIAFARSPQIRAFLIMPRWLKGGWCEYTYFAEREWHSGISFDFSAQGFQDFLRYGMGRLNTEPYEGAAPGTLLLHRANWQDGQAHVYLMERPHGWNCVWSLQGHPMPVHVYDAADFTALFNEGVIQ